MPLNHLGSVPVRALGDGNQSRRKQVLLAEGLQRCTVLTHPCSVDIHRGHRPQTLRHLYLFKIKHPKEFLVLTVGPGLTDASPACWADRWPTAQFSQPGVQPRSHSQHELGLLAPLQAPLYSLSTAAVGGSLSAHGDSRPTCSRTPARGSHSGHCRGRRCRWPRGCVMITRSRCREHAAGPGGGEVPREVPLVLPPRASLGQPHLPGEGLPLRRTSFLA